MSEVVVVGSFKAQPGKEAEALEAFKALVEPTHGEEGCILYALHRAATIRARARSPRTRAASAAREVQA